jgi:hypothetical protein
MNPYTKIAIKITEGLIRAIEISRSGVTRARRARGGLTAIGTADP